MGSVALNPEAVAEDWQKFPEERTYVLDAIAKENINGVIFLTGDIHRGELSKLERKDNYPLYEITASPLTAGVSKYDGPNSIRLDGTLVQEHNFALFSVTGQSKNRTLNIKMFNADGDEKWTYTINENELKAEK